jgi:branched-chain amino acid transport system permease protein
LAFVISAFFAGISGALWAGNQGIITPNEFGYMKSVEILVMVILGGMGSMVGSIISASGLTLLPIVLQSYLKNFNNYRMIIYALILILVMIYRPSGLMGNYKFSISKFFKRSEKE